MVYIGLGTRFLARFFDLVIVFVVAFLVSLFLTLILISFNQNQFQAFSDYTDSTKNSNFNINQTNFQQNSGILNCQHSTDPTTCIQAEDFFKKQAILFISTFTILHLSYFGMFTISRFQATFGKILFKIKVVNDRLDPINVWQALTREVFFALMFVSVALSLYQTEIRVAGSFLELILIIDCLKILFTKDKTSLHDNIAFTKVISTK